MKRALIITYYWPPAGGPGVQRWLNFVKYLPDFGISPIIYIPDNPHYPLIDNDLTHQVPDGIEILRHPIKEPYKFARIFSKKKTSQLSSGIIPEKQSSLLEKLMLYIRGNYFIPDARVAWVEPSVKFLDSYLSGNPVDVIITTGPPHSLHLIGLQLKSNINIKWVADFRDPWTTIHYHKSLRLTRSSERKHKKLEAEVLQAADHIIVTSPGTRTEFSEITPNPITVITNGFDITEPISAKPDSDFTISHIGSLLSERNPEVLWQVLAELATEEKKFAERLKIQLVGAVSENAIESIEACGLKDHYTAYGYVSHSEAKQLQHNSRVLLLVESDTKDTAAIIPGKLFEYLAAKRPIIALGPEGSDIKKIVEETASGGFFRYSEKTALKAKILEFYRAYERGEASIDSTGIEKYSRKSLTEKLSGILKML